MSIPSPPKPKPEPPGDRMDGKFKWLRGVLAGDGCDLDFSVQSFGEGNPRWTKAVIMQEFMSRRLRKILAP